MGYRGEPKANQTRIGDQRKRSVVRPIQKASDRYAQFLDGTLTAEDFTDDEVIRGRLANAEGKFYGRPPKMVPSALTKALAGELQRRMNDRLRTHAFDAIDTIIEVMDLGEGASERHGQKDGTGRFVAAKYVLERIIGKIPDKVEINQNTTIWQGMQDGDGLLVDVESDQIEAYEEAEITDETPPPPTRRGPRTRPQTRRNPGQKPRD